MCGDNSYKANYIVSTGKKLGRVRSKEVSENNVLIKIEIIKYKMTMSTLLLLLIITLPNNNNNYVQTTCGPTQLPIQLVPLVIPSK
jgi:hypothetical protein